jgi:CheY-like chemotaxis protein
MGLSILLAEDERDIREFLVISLQLNGYEVVEARNGEEAVAMAHRHRPDLILLDVRMPKVTGYQACEMLKSAPDTADIPVVFLSAFAQESEVEQGLALGAEAYLTKPIAPDELNQRLKAVLERFSVPRGERVRLAAAG